MSKSGGRARLRCPCGQPLHYCDAASEAFMKRQVRALGPTVAITTTDGTWMVPRHFLALHPLRPWELPALAEQFGWEAV